MTKIFETNFKQWRKNLVRSHIFETENQDEYYKYMVMSDEELLEICGLNFKTASLMNGEKFRSCHTRFVEPYFIVIETAVF